MTHASSPFAHRWPARAFALCALVATLSGCAVQRMNERTSVVESDHANALVDLQRLQTAKELTKTRPVLRSMDHLWVDTTPVNVNAQSLKKNNSILRCPVTVNQMAPMGIEEFAQLVSDACRVSVNVSPDVQMELAKGAGAASNAVGAARLPSPNVSGVNAIESPVLAAAMGASSGGMITGLSWVNKPLSGLLDLVTGRLGLGWKVEGDTIRIFYTDTQVFQLYSIPGKVDVNTTVSSGASSGGSSGGNSSSGSGSSGGSGGFNADGSTQSTSVSFSTDVLADIENTIKTMITPTTGRMSMSHSTGTITVTDTPSVLRRVEAFVKDQNHQLTRQVVLNVRVVSVQTKDSDAMGVNWDAVYSSMERVAGGFGAGSVAAAGSPNLFGNLKVISSSSNWNGTQLFLDALSKQGRVSTLTNPSVRTLNLRPAPILVGKQTSYLAEVSTTSLAGGVAGSNSTQSMTPGTITTGFNMTLLPYLMQGKDMLLQYNINLSSLIGMNEVEGKDGNKIQLPNVDNRIFSQTVRLRSGETLVISGFDQTATNSARQGVGDADFWLLGGKGDAAKDRDTIVVLITPIITD